MDRLGMKKLVAAGVAALGTAAALAGVGKMDAKPLWDLADHGGPTAINPQTKLEIPNSCLPDSYAFTIEAKFRFDDMTDNAIANLFDCTVSETGFGAYCDTIRGSGKCLHLKVNGNGYGGSGCWFLQDVTKGVAHWKPNGTELKVTISARKGWLSVYVNDYLQNSYLLQVTPNLAPIRFGGEAYARNKKQYPDMKGVMLLSCKIWDGLEEYWGLGEPKKKESGFAAGKGWQVRVPVEPIKGAPNVFYYGDSISVGYTPPLRKLTKGKANLYHWMSSLYVPGEKGVDTRKFAEIGKLAQYDYAVLNNGLHSLHWTPEKVSDDAIRASYRTLVRTVRQMCKPNAKIIYLMTTPRTNRRNAAGVIRGYDPENEIVLRLNRIAARVMAEENVTVIDLYAMLKDRFQFANGDGFHLVDAAYRKIAEAIAVEIGVKPRPKDPELVCIYYPEWHVYPEWEAYYGKGSTEWCCVTNARPKFPGHYQPIVPLMGYYDEATPATAAKEIDLAADHGINVFLYDWYWANGKPIQHEALESGFQKAPNKKKMKFAIMWAYHDRDVPFQSKFGAEKQHYLWKLARTPEDFLAAFAYCAKTYMTDPSYWRKGGHPFFSMYSSQDFVKDMGGPAKTKELLAQAQKIAKGLGLPAVHFNAMVFSADYAQPALDAGFDSTSVYSMAGFHYPKGEKMELAREFLMDYDDLVGAMADVNGALAKISPMHIPLVSRGWDCTPRCDPAEPFPWRETHYPYMGIYTNATPAAFEAALRTAKEMAMDDPKQPGAVLINAWNEYTEGSWLLPDTQNGYDYLKAVRNVFGRRHWAPLKARPIRRTDDAPAEVKASPLFRKSLAILGDSYVQNHMAPKEESWHYRLAEKYQMEYLSWGMSGNCITIHRVGQHDWGSPMDHRYYEMFHADYILVIGGHNDACWIGKHENGRELFRQGLSDLLDKLKRDYPYSKILFVTPWDVHEPGFADVLEIEREVVPAKGVAFFDAAKDSGIDPNSADFRKKYFQGPNDTAHLNAAGHGLMLARIERFLRAGSWWR